MELDSEKFATIKELSELQAALATARVELEKAKTELSDFIIHREEEATKAVEASLLASRELLMEAEQNRDVVSSLLAQALDVIKTLNKFSDGLKEAEETHTKKVSEFQVLVKEKSDQILIGIQELKAQRRMLEDEQKNLSVREKKIHEGEVLLKDRLEMLRQDIERIKGVKLK